MTASQVDEDDFTEPAEDYSAKAEAPRRIEFEVGLDLAGLRLDHALQELLPDYSRSRMQAWVKAGAVTVDGAVVTPREKVWNGARIVVVVPDGPEITAFRAEDIPLHPVYEDDEIIVLDKPAGLVVHPGSGNWSGTLLNALLHHAPQVAQVPRAGIVHRLDKDTTGLMVVAKTLRAQTDLVRQLQARSVTREYRCVVDGVVMDAGTVEAPVGRHPVNRLRMAVTGNGKPAVTHYRVLERLPWHTLIECRLETGRTHQIRVHMESIGHPLAGDPVYGARRPVGGPAVRAAVAALGRQALHAVRLALDHPATGERCAWHAPLPADMETLLRILRDDG